MLCGQCAASLREQLGGLGGKAGRFLRALGLGVGAAILGGALYGGVMILAKSEWGIISIAVGWFVGKAVRLGSGERGGWRYQITAAGLTYAAICGAYVFAIYQGLEEPGLNAVIGLTLLAYRLPFLGGLENFLGILIIAFGVFQAWQMNRGVTLEITGPHPLAPGAPAIPPASA